MPRTSAPGTWETTTAPGIREEDGAHVSDATQRTGGGCRRSLHAQKRKLPALLNCPAGISTPEHHPSHGSYPDSSGTHARWSSRAGQTPAHTVRSRSHHSSHTQACPSAHPTRLCSYRLASATHPTRGPSRVSKGLTQRRTLAVLLSVNERSVENRRLSSPTNRSIHVPAWLSTSATRPACGRSTLYPLHSGQM